MRTRGPVIAAIGIALVLAGCAPGGGSGTPSPTPGESDSSSPSPEPTPTTSVSESPGPDPEPDPEPVGLDAADRENLRDAVTSGNTAAIEGYLSDPVTYILAASECCGPITPIEAVANLSYLESAVPPWDFSLPEATIDSWRASTYYGYLIPEDVVVGMSSDGMIVAFGIVGDEVISVFVGYEELMSE